MIRHIMADGTERESVAGLVIPYDGKTETVYKVILENLSEGGGAVDSIPENQAQTSQSAAN